MPRPMLKAASISVIIRIMVGDKGDFLTMECGSTAHVIAMSIPRRSRYSNDTSLIYR